MALNCAAVPEHLIESELFGYEKGAFTGAMSQKKGKFELANRGTLFLDEVGDMSLATQAKLLRVLESRKVERLGGTTSIDVDVRILSATNKDLAAEIAKQTFRDDLYYRLRVVLLKLPPLREHKEDIPILTQEFCRMLGDKHGRAPISISRPALERLVAAEWKGNVRQLKHVLESAIVMSKGNELQPSDFTADSITPSADNSATGDSPQAGEPLMAALLKTSDFRKAKEQFEIAYITAQLRSNGGNITRTAAAIGLHRQSLQQKVRELGIDVERK